MSGRIVVGVDGSDGAHRALEWAVEEARLRKTGLLVVHAWHVPPLVTGAGPFDAPVALDADTLERVEKTANEIVDRELLSIDTAGIEIERLVEPRSPADALIAAATGADLLVVGTRGHGGFAGLLLGSVGQQAAHHAPCPVVIVPKPKS
jgi:nucleotide-binding universal stress UspA family protein